MAKRKKPSRELMELSEDLTLMDDAFMTLFFENNPKAVEFVLSIILDRNDLHVLKVETQKKMKSPLSKGRDVYLDVYAEDSQGKHYDIEIQNANSGASPQRARVYSSHLDSKMLMASEDFTEIKESYVIFITKNDVLKKGCPVYHIDRCIKELDYMDFNDGNHIIYVNGSFSDDSTPIGRLMKDFGCSRATDMHYDILKKGMSHFKDNEKGLETVSDKLETYCKKREAVGIEEGIKKGIKEGSATAKRENAKRMIASGKLTMEEVASFSDLSLSEVIELANKKAD